MAADGEGHDFMSRLLSSDDLPRLNDDDLAKLRAFLAAPLRPSVIQNDASEHERRRKLETILNYNENRREQGGISGTCFDAELLLDFVYEADALTGAIDTLHEQGEGPQDRALHGARELVIRSAGNLQRKIRDIRDALNRQTMLTGERKDTLANLSRSLDYIANCLRSSLANSWGYRITEDCAPPEVVQEWNGYWHAIRHTAISMKQWAQGMADEAEVPTGSKAAQEQKEVKALPHGDPERNGTFMPADWFRVKFGIPSSRLRAARRDGRLHAFDVGTTRPRYHYSVPDAMRLWTDDGIYLPDASG